MRVCRPVVTQLINLSRFRYVRRACIVAVDLIPVAAIKSRMVGLYPWVFQNCSMAAITDPSSRAYARKVVPFLSRM